MGAQSPAPRGAKHGELCWSGIEGGKINIEKEFVGKGASLMKLTVTVFPHHIQSSRFAGCSLALATFFFLFNKAVMYPKGQRIAEMEKIVGRGSAGGGDQNGFVSAKNRTVHNKDREKQIRRGKMRLRNSEGVKAGLSLTEPTGSESITENWRQIEAVREITFV